MRKLYSMLALVLMTGLMFAQGSLSGTVTDGSGNALYGANVSIQGSSTGAATNEDGSYSIDNLKDGSYTVKVSYIGYESVSSSVTISGGSTTANFALSSSALSGNSVSVLGSRFARNINEQAVPVEVITELEIRAAGFTETNELLQSLVPSYNAPRGYITDGSDHMRPATLRGMSPNQTLVLVNGKRRHQGALVHVNGSVGRGSTQVDLNAIPASAIEKIEVLRDGASALYGSDAVAGVINIILKESGGTDLSVTYGQHLSYFERGYNAGEGMLPGQGASSFGWDLDSEHEGNGYLPFTPGRGWARSGVETVLKNDGKNLILHGGSGLNLMGGNLYLSGQIRDGGRTNRTGLDPRQQYFSGAEYAAKEAAFDRENHRIGAGEFEQVSLMWNGSFPLERGTLYTFGGYNTRDGQSGCYYRRANDNRTLRAWYPDGFLPLISPTLSDKSMAIGLKGLNGDYAYDISVTTGSNDFAWGMENSHNATAGVSEYQQSEFDLGTLGYSQTTFNLDITTQLDGSDWPEPFNIDGPINLAMGVEARMENYTIEAGEEAGYADFGYDVLDGPNAGASAAVGCQCLPGLAPNNETDRDREAYSFYVDAEADVRENLLMSVALRTETYSDFGSTTNGKVAMRYELQDGLAARASYSTGFRAPALQEAYFSSIATNFINGIPYEIGTFPVDTEAARALGAVDLEPETSINRSMGFTYNDDVFSLAIDAYNIIVEDRISVSENFTGSGMVAFFNERGIPASGGRYFFNGINTETNGLDVVATMKQDLAKGGSLLLKAALNFNDTEVTNKDDLTTPAALSAYTSQSLLGSTNITRFESSAPRDNVQLSATVQKPSSTLMVKMNRWGEVTIPDSKQILSAKWTTDMEYSFQVSSQARLALGANNLFDVYPDKTNKSQSFNGIFQHSGYSPFGFFGRYLYSRLDISF
jgi:iron complex outermembrane receptor protein